MKKTNILFLSTFDRDLPGHAFSIMKKLPQDKYETRLFVLSNKYKNTQYSLVGGEIKEKIYRRLLNILQTIYVFFKFKIWPKTDKSHIEYCYYTNDFIPSYANIILRKLNGFKPDIISLHWTATFISSATIRDLYRKTSAKIVITFIDQQHMMGGCHYAIDCEGYKTGCYNCPALIRGKNLSHYQLENKRKNLRNVPVIIHAAPQDIRLATTESYLFKDMNCKTITALGVYENIISIPRDVARKKFSIGDDSFVVLLACSSFRERRKGLVYALEALRQADKKIKNLVVLVAGKIREEELSSFSGFEFILTGYLSLKELFEVYCASDCFLSPTIGDSGPMMVNFAIELGVPVVSFNVGIAETLVLHKETGYIAKYKDSNDLAKGLEYIANLTGEEYSRMSARCKELLPSLESNEPWYEQAMKI